MLKFGGHAAAAGVTIRTSDFEKFRKAFEKIAQAMLTPADLKHVIETDGDLDESEMNLELARQIGDQVWGQGFAQPTFITRFQVQDQRVVAERHLKLKLRRRQASAVSGEQKAQDGQLIRGNIICPPVPLPEVIEAVYRVQVNEFKGSSTLQLVLDHWFQPDALTPDQPIWRGLGVLPGEKSIPAQQFIPPPSLSVASICARKSFKYWHICRLFNEPGPLKAPRHVKECLQADYSFARINNPL